MVAQQTRRGGGLLRRKGGVGGQLKKGNLRRDESARLTVGEKSISREMLEKGGARK